MYYKITREDGNTLFNHNDKNICYKEGMVVEEKNFDSDPSKECGKGIYVVEGNDIPLWWIENPKNLAIWKVEILGKSVKIGKGIRCSKIKMVKRLSDKEIEELGKKHIFNWFERSRITESNNVMLQAGNYSTLKAGWDSTLTADNESTLKAGNNSTLKAGWNSTLKAGFDSTLTAGDGSTLTAGFDSTLKAGFDSTLKAGWNSTLTAGDYSTLTADWNSTLKAGWNSTLTAGDYSTLTAGLNSVCIIQWYDKSEWKTTVRKITKKYADKAYRFESGNWIRIKEEEN